MNLWEEYERQKKEIIAANLTPQEYKKAIKELCDLLEL